MTPTRVHPGPTLPALSPEALAAVAWPLDTDGAGNVVDNNRNCVIEIYIAGGDVGDQKWAAYIAALLNSLYAPVVDLAEQHNEKVGTAMAQ